MIALLRTGLPLATLLACLNALAMPGQTATPVVVHKVATETVSDRIEALGTLRANEAVALTANAPDIITKVLFEDGQQVQAGDLLVQMASDQELAQQQEAQHKVAEAKAQLERVQAVAKRGGASRSLVDERQREYKVAQSQLTAIQSQLRDRQVVAPFSGTVGLRTISPGAYVSPGEVITTLVDNTSMKLDFSIPSVWLATLQPGTSITATSRALPGQTFSGTVSAINNIIDPVSRSITIRANLPNPEGQLRAGLLMEIELHTQERSAITVPEEAITSEGYQHFVLRLLENGDSRSVEKVEVKLGKRWFGKVEITQGLQPGEQVVTHGNARPGQAVRIVDLPFSTDSE